MTDDSPDADGTLPGAQSSERARVAELEGAAAQAVTQLAMHADPEAFQALLRLSALVGECLGSNARALATHGSWARVAEVAGTSRQAAWSRWSS